MDKARAVFIIIWQVFHQFAPEFKMKPGKSAVLPMMYGPGSEHGRHQVANLNGLLRCEVWSGKCVDLSIVKSYKHIGKRLTASGSMMPEIMARHGTCTPVIARLGATFFAKLR